MECAEFDSNAHTYTASRKKRDKPDMCTRLFEARESAADLAVALEEKARNKTDVIVHVDVSEIYKNSMRPRDPLTIFFTLNFLLRNLSAGMFNT